MWYNYPREIHKSSLYKSETRFKAYIVVQDAETRYPCRQLNSRTIKSAALCYLSPVVLGKCSIISAKCACKVQEEGFENAWNGVCRTRDACDKALQGLFICVLFEMSSFSVVVLVE